MGSDSQWNVGLRRHPDNVTNRWFLPADQTRRWSTTSKRCRHSCCWLANVIWHIDAHETLHCHVFMLLMCVWINSFIFFWRMKHICVVSNITNLLRKHLRLLGEAANIRKSWANLVSVSRSGVTTANDFVHFGEHRRQNSMGIRPIFNTFLIAYWTQLNEFCF